MTTMNTMNTEKITWVLVSHCEEWIDSAGNREAISYTGESATLPAAKRAARRRWSEALCHRAEIRYYEDGGEIYGELNPYGIRGDWTEIDMY